MEVVARQFVKYEWLPVKCSHCHMLGHEEGECRKKTRVIREWRPINQHTNLDISNKPTLKWSNKIKRVSLLLGEVHRGPLYRLQYQISLFSKTHFKFYKRG